MRPARVSLTMIVRNEETNLPRCLESVRGLFDEIVVVDTGSTDRTVEIARSFGARVFHFPWCDDFSAARNEALRHATGSHVFRLDADEYAEPAERDKLLALFDKLPARNGSAYAMHIQGRSPGDASKFRFDCVRLFPRRREVVYERRIHEQIAPSLRRADVQIRLAEVVIQTDGYGDAVTIEAKRERNRLILLKDLEDHPDDGLVLLCLGATAADNGQVDEAFGYLLRGLAAGVPGDLVTSRIRAELARLYIWIGDRPRAIQTCRDGLTLDPDDAELIYHLGNAMWSTGAAGDAEAAWLRLLALTPPADRLVCLDLGLYGHLPRRALARAAARRHARDQVERLWLEVLDECPGDLEAVVNLAHGYVTAGDPDRAIEVCGLRVSECPTVRFWEASALRAKGETLEARAAWESTLAAWQRGRLSFGVDEGVYSAFSLLNLAAIAAELGDVDPGPLVARAVELEPRLGGVELEPGLLMLP